MTASFNPCATFRSRQMRLVSRWSFRAEMVHRLVGVQLLAGPREGRLALLLLRVTLPSSLWNRIILRGLDSEGTHDWFLWELLWDIGI